MSAVRDIAGFFDDVDVLRGLSGWSATAICGVRAEVFADALEPISGAVERCVPGLSAASIGRALVDGEGAASSFIGNGVCVPRILVSGLERSIHVVAVLAESLTYRWRESPEAEVRVIWTVLSPADRTDRHVRTLSAVASVCNDPQWVQGLVEACGTEKLSALLEDVLTSH